MAVGTVARRVRSGVATVGVAGVMALTMTFVQAPVARADVGIIPVISGAAAGVVTAGAEVVAVPGELVAGALLGGFWAGYSYVGPRISWAWNGTHVGETAGASGGYSISPAVTLPLSTSGTFTVTKAGSAGTYVVLKTYPTGTAPALGSPEPTVPTACSSGTYVQMNSSGQATLSNGSGCSTMPQTLLLIGGLAGGSTSVLDRFGVAAPQHRIKSTLVCANGQTLTGLTGLFREADTVIPAPVSLQCPVGVRPSSASFAEGDANGANAPAAVTQTWTAPAGWAAPSSTDPLADCYPGGSSAPCAVTLLKVAGSVVQPCSDPSVDCSAYSTASTSTTFQCRWGPHVVATSQCGGLVGVYQPIVPSSVTPIVPGAVIVGVPVTVTNPDGSTTTTTTQQSPTGTLSRVTVVTLPSGQRTVTTVAVDVNGNATGTPVVTVIPGTLPTGSPGDSPAAGDAGCSFGLKPWLWPYRALTCAFVPSSTTMPAAWSTVNAGWTSTGIPAWGSALGGVGTSLAGLGSGAGGCAGPHFSFTLKGHSYAFDPLNACSDPMRGVAVVVKLFATIAVLVAGARFCARPLMAAIGMGEAV